MQCTSPRTVGFLADGKTITFSKKNFSKEYSTFQLPCGKCLSCRLEYARQWAIRCVHESQMHENNAFLTLTYTDQNLASDKLQYKDFQLFIKRLRSYIFQEFLKTYGKENWKLLDKAERKKLYEKHQIGFFVTGEYGDRTKRPHWHAIIFNWSPGDATYKYSNDRGDKVYQSKILEELWSKGITEFGSVTFESAGYCARYAAKKLSHGRDNNHDYHPLSKKSNKQAIGKSWLEKNYKDVFNNGQLVLPNGKTSSIPRYYEKWLKAQHPEEYKNYVTRTKLKKTNRAQTLNRRIQETFEKESIARGIKGATISPAKTRAIILKTKFNQLQQKLKLK